MNNYNTILTERQQKYQHYQVKFKVLEKQTKTIKDQGRKHIETFKVKKLSIKDAIPKNQLSEETKNEIEKIRNRKKVKREEFIFSNIVIYTISNNKIFC